jgi:hypothetical protein
MAVEVATRSDTPHGSIVFTREGDGREYRAGFECTELAIVAKSTRDLDAGFLMGTNDVDPSFLDYVRPLVGAMPAPGRLSDFPVEKRLG